MSARRRSRRSRRHGVRAKGREYEVDAIVFATGFDAMTGALLKIDIRGRGGLALQREVERGAAHLSRAGDGRLPQPVHHHRSGQPLGADQHAAHHRAARRLDRRHASRYMRDAALRRASSRARRRRRSGWRTSARLAGRTLRYTCSSWYLGVNIPGKPRVFMPYIGGFPKYVAEMQRGRGGRLRGLRAELGGVRPSGLIQFATGKYRSQNGVRPGGSDTFCPERWAQPVVRRSSSTVAA